MPTRTQINTDSVQSMSGPKTMVSPILNGGTCTADPTAALGVATKQYVDAKASAVPVGALMPYGGASAPAGGWLLCDGSAVSRATYSALFAVLSTAFGVGDNATTFNIPDLRGRIPLGIDGTANRITSASLNGSNADTRGGVGGAETHVLTEAQLAIHDHGLGQSHGTGAATYPGVTVNMGSIHDVDDQVAISNAGSGSAHNNMQPWIAVNYIIKT